MSFNPDSPSTTNRDSIFPSQPFNLPRTPARRFSSPYPRTTLFQNSLSPPPPSNSTSPLRRRISHRHRIVKQESSVRDEIHNKANDGGVLSEDSPKPGTKQHRLIRNLPVYFAASLLVGRRLALLQYW